MIERPSSDVEPRPPTEARRIRGFATFFRNYMSVSAVVVAAAPIPISALHLIPTFDAIRGLVMTLASLVSFLLLAYVFFTRVNLGRAWFAGGRCVTSFTRLLPLVLILCCGAAMLVYLDTLNRSLASLAGASGNGTLLRRTDYGDIPNSALLVFSQVGFFAAAELAFILMALREYLQDVLAISDAELIRDKRARMWRPTAEFDLAQSAANLVLAGKAAVIEARSESARANDCLEIEMLASRHRMTVRRQLFDRCLSQGLADGEAHISLPHEEAAEATGLPL